MSDGKGINFEASASSKKNYRKLRMSKEYWTECGSPDVNNELFRKAVYIGYGSSAIRILLTGLDPRVNDVHLTAEFMGYNEGTFEIIVKE